MSDWDDEMDEAATVKPPHRATVGTTESTNYLRFCLVRNEHSWGFDKSYPIDLMFEPNFPELVGHLPMPEIEQIIRGFDETKQVFRLATTYALEETGVSDNLLKSERFDPFLDDTALTKMRAFRRSTGLELQPVPKPTATNYKFAAETVHGTIAGVHMAFGQGKTTATASFLDQGVPASLQSVTPWNVRDAFYSFMKTVRANVGRRHELWQVWAKHFAWNAHLNFALWEYLGGSQHSGGDKAQADLLRLIDTGEIHKLCADLVEKRRVAPNNATFVLPMIEHELAALKAEQKRRAIAQSSPPDPSGNSTRRAAQ